MVRPYAHFRTQTVVAVYILLRLGNADYYIVYVTSLAILRTVTARGKLAGVTNCFYSGP